MEFVAPAGNLEKLKIALAYGAKAIYLAGQRFGLRSGADNFSLAELSQATALCRAQGAKLYLAINAMLLDEELAALPEYLQEIKPLAPDAVIAGDLAVAAMVGKVLGCPLHVSTQANVQNSVHAQMWKDQGATRLVPGRELSLAEAGELGAKTGLEVEVFIHGALCMAYSGFCTISNYLAGRDSNRGGCIQSCRFEYQLETPQGETAQVHFLNSKDLKGIAFLPEFQRYGITAAKIEGRMKTGLYLASSLRAYLGAWRDFQTGNWQNLAYWEEELKKIPHRDYTSGNLAGPAGAEATHWGQGEAQTEFALAGQVLDTWPGGFALLCKNKLLASEGIALLLPQGPAQEISLAGMQNALGQPIPQAQPGQVVRLPGVAQKHWVARVRR